jgi:putative oxidoreductase
MSTVAAVGHHQLKLRSRWNRFADRLTGWVAHDVLALAARIALAAIFFLSGRTKVDGWLSVSDTAYTLFREDYKLPIVPPELAAHLAAYAEHLFPLFLLFGLCARFSGLALLGMTAAIQIFVYPDAWPTHLAWATLMLYLLGRGGGRISLDHTLGMK